MGQLFDQMRMPGGGRLLKPDVELYVWVNPYSKECCLICLAKAKVTCLHE